MPIALKQEPNPEEGCELLLPALRPLDAGLFDELEDLYKKTERFIEEEKEDRKKLEILTRNIAQAQEMVAKAEEKRDALLKKNLTLKNSLEDMKYRISQAEKYWRDYGVDAKKVSCDNDDFEQYEFIYFNLGGGSQKLEQLTNGDSEEPSYRIGLKFHDKQLEIVTQDPQVFELDKLNELSAKLTANCVNDDMSPVDYKSAMILIKKALTTHLCHP